MNGYEIRTIDSTYLYTRFPISMEHKTLKGKRDECELIR